MIWNWKFDMKLTLFLMIWNWNLDTKMALLSDDLELKFGKNDNWDEEITMII